MFLKTRICKITLAQMNLAHIIYYIIMSITWHDVNTTRFYFKQYYSRFKQLTTILLICSALFPSQVDQNRFIINGSFDLARVFECQLNLNDSRDMVLNHSIII